MLLTSILLLVVITIVEIVVPITAVFSNASAIIGLIVAIICVAASIISIIACAKRIKANNERGKSIAALVISIINTVESASLLIVSIFLLVARTAVVVQ